MINDVDYEAITGMAADDGFDDVVARVVLRMNGLTGRDLVTEYTVEEPTLDVNGDPVLDVNGDPVLGPVLRAPYELQEACAWGVHTLTSPTAAPPVPHGATSLSIAGEYTVAMMQGSVLGHDGFLIPQRFAYASDLGGRCVSMTLRYRRITIGF